MLQTNADLNSSHMAGPEHVIQTRHVMMVTAAFIGNATNDITSDTPSLSPLCQKFLAMVLLAVLLHFIAPVLLPLQVSPLLQERSWIQ